MLVTADEVRKDAAKVDALMLSFEETYLHFIDKDEDEPEMRLRCAMSFQVLRDLVTKLVNDLEVLSGHMEVCDAIFAVSYIDRRKELENADSDKQ